MNIPQCNNNLLTAGCMIFKRHGYLLIICGNFELSVGGLLVIPQFLKMTIFTVENF